MTFSPNGATPGSNVTSEPPIGADLTWTADSGVAHATGTTLTFRFTVDLLASSVSGAMIPNTGFAGTTTRDGSSVAGERAEPLRSGSATLNVVTPDLNVTKSDGVTTAAPGDPDLCRDHVDAVDNEVVAPIVPIPVTGAEVTRLVVPAVLLIGGGIVLLVVTRRPRASRRRGHARRSLI